MRVRRRHVKGSLFVGGTKRSPGETFSCVLALGVGVGGGWTACQQGKTACCYSLLT